ncbi:DUF58 domain-containing protein [Rubripirellula reticaptiva]|uniref:DUF58 domain-containing protein n=1 Tax=Rubripirellula reticaptiva TaxID=2528013 RepID=A0A5C6F757_9BACT|nr:DUF58 domain-containing protein [Rubripirellula reticaptiva]TWU56314.1 hypothetical protein Poly59_26180 [Rubripirellula reticaptiva]
MKNTLQSNRDAARAAELSNRGDLVDPRVQTNLHELVRLRAKAKGFSFLPKQPVNSLLAGRHASRVRGRGLNFEEIRAYHAGDDIRTIDWKVTARLRSPHTRVFTEERDRPTLLVVDQRIGMFFGTQHNMKSVSAAETAALAAWRVIDVGDRVGMIAFDDAACETVRIGRSRDGVMRMLRCLVDFGNRLHADSPAKPNASMLCRALDAAERIATHDHLVVVISDFFGLDDMVRRRLRKIRSHNDVIATLVHDPIASQLPTSGQFVISDGELQVEVPDKGRAMKRLKEATAGRIAEVLSLQQELRIPVLPISAGEDTSHQVQRLMGRH